MISASLSYKQELRMLLLVELIKAADINSTDTKRLFDHTDAMVEYVLEGKKASS